MAKQQLNWKQKSETGDYDGGLNFLMLVFTAAQSKRLLRALRQAKSIERAAKDLLRASNSPLLPKDDPRAVEDLNSQRQATSTDFADSRQYDKGGACPHRRRISPNLCRLLFDESAPVPCRMVGV